MTTKNQDAGSGTFKRAPRRKKEPVTRVSLSAADRQQYEQLARERDQRQRSYEGHLPTEKPK